MSRHHTRIGAVSGWSCAPLSGATPAADTPPEINFEDQIDTTQGWFAKCSPGFPLLLSLGYLAYCPWLVNPVLGLFLLAGASSVASLYGTAVTNAAVLPVAFSAYTLLYSVGCLSHAFAALVGLGAVGLAMQAVRRRSLGAVAACFARITAGNEIRPYTGAVIAFLCAIYTCWGFRDSPALLRGTAWIVGAAVLFHNIIYLSRPAIVETLFTTVPLVVLAAGYACMGERQFRQGI